MANVLGEQKRHQVIALGRLGWLLRRIETAIGVRRETASAYLKAAAIAIPHRRWGHAAKPAKEVSTDRSGAKPANGAEVSTDSVLSRTPPAAAPAAPDGPAPPPPSGRAPTASACEPFRELIEQAPEHGRNAMAIYQDLVSDHGFGAKYASVCRFVNRGVGGTLVPFEHVSHEILKLAWCSQQPGARHCPLRVPHLNGSKAGLLLGPRCSLCFPRPHQ